MRSATGARLRALTAEHVTPGGLVRSVRRERGLTLEQLGERTGYSASQLSRLERELAPMTVDALRLIADALGIPAETISTAFNAITLGGRGHDGPTGPYPSLPTPTLRRREDGDNVRRRRFLATTAAAVTAAAALPGGQAHADDTQLSELLVSRLRDAMLGLGTPAPCGDGDHLAAELDHAHRDYRTGGYASLAVRLPRLLSTAHAAPSPDHTLLARSYLLTTRLLIKLDEQQLGWMAADRARQLAATSGAAVLVAESSRQLAVLARKAQWHDQALTLTLALTAAEAPELREAGIPGGALRGLLIQSAAYTSAWKGDAAGMRELTTEAAAVAADLGGGTYHLEVGGFSPATVQLHLVSAENSAGDPSRALAAAEAVDPATLPSAERRARLHTDMAHAHHRWGHRDACVTSILAAERCAPQETHARPAVRALVSGLLLSGRTTPDLRGLATRVGASRP
nr:helix-turn-helix transcriptional regulator [Streptomyces tubbatahanensis]